MNCHIRAIPSMFDHTVLGSSTMESYYHWVFLKRTGQSWQIGRESLELMQYAVSM
jgi:hypothetical protein